MNEEDRGDLIAFVGELREDLHYVFDAAAEYVDPRILDGIGPAWSAIEERNEFDRLQDAIADGENDDPLTAAGLSGAELQFKITGYRAARDDVRAADRPPPRLLKRLLGWGDVILGSLAATIGFGEAIKEVKEGVETELEAAG